MRKVEALAAAGHTHTHLTNALCTAVGLERLSMVISRIAHKATCYKEE
jgi:hypothetical protein